MKKYIIISVGVAVLAVAAFFMHDIGNPDEEYAADVYPVLVSNFVDLNKIDKISKFRSCQGHTVVPVDESESKRNMKHYLWVKPEFAGGKDVALYAPFLGEISSIFAIQEEGLEGELWLGIDGSEWAFSFEHIKVLDDLSEGDKVLAGDLLGYAEHESFDVVYAIGAKTTKVIDGYTSPFAALDSAFNHMSDEAFSEYVSAGVSDRSELIYTKEYRDADPCEYRDDKGGLNDAEHPEDWVPLIAS